MLPLSKRCAGTQRQALPKCPLYTFINHITAQKQTFYVKKINALLLAKHDLERAHTGTRLAWSAFIDMQYMHEYSYKC